MKEKLSRVKRRNQRESLTPRGRANEVFINPDRFFDTLMCTRPPGVERRNRHDYKLASTRANAESCPQDTA